MNHLKALKQRLKSKRFDWRRFPEFWRDRIKTLKKTYCEGYKEGWEDRSKIPLNDSAHFEDNNGGDIIELDSDGDGFFSMKVGQDCVYIFRKVGTISEIVEYLRDHYDAYRDHYE